MNNNGINSVRIDKWLWAVRICKTRLMAADLCRKQKVSVEQQKVKPSKEVKAGQIITVRQEGIDWQYRVVRCIEKRVSAALASECREDLTSEEEINKLKIIKSNWGLHRPRGAGRPTKKDRRAIDRFFQE